MTIENPAMSEVWFLNAKNVIQQKFTGRLLKCMVDVQRMKGM
jgi:hypothetical protein